MTSSPAHASSAARPVPVRRAAPSRLRRASECVLVSGSVLAIAAAFGPAWATRVGIAVAVTAAVLACIFAWRELFAAERTHARSTLQASQRHGAQLRQERERNAEVVGVLRQRVQDTTAVVDGQRVTIAALRHEVFSLEGDRTQLRSDLQQRDRVISSLRGTVRAQRADLDSLQQQVRELTERELEQRLNEPELGELDAAEIHHMPRRRAELEAAAPARAAVDARMLETAAFGAAVLPNYEEDRRLA